MASIILIKGDDTNWNDQQSFVINLDTTLDLTQGFSAQFTIGNIVKEFDSIADNKIYPVLTNKETSQLPLGYINGVLKIYDSEKRIKTIKSNIPFVVQKGVFTSNKDINADGESLPVEEINLTINSTDIIDYNSVVNKPVLNGHELKGDVVLTKSDIGLSNVDNTSDLNKPISTAAQNALDKKADKAELDETNTRVEANSTELTNIKADIVDIDADINGLTTEVNKIENDYALKTEIPDVSDFVLDSELASVAKTGSYNDLKDQPIIPPSYTLPKASNTVLGGIKVGNNLTITEDGTLNAQASGETGTSNYNDLINQPQINSVILSGNKTLEDLGIQALGDYALKSEIPDTSNLASKSEIPTKTSQLTNDSNFLTSIPSTYVTELELNEKGYATQAAVNTALASKLDITTASTTYASKTELDNTADDLALVTNQVGAQGESINDLTTSVNNLSNTKADKTEVPEAYTLPTASTTTLGGVKVDGTSITINNGVISSSGSVETDTSNLVTLDNEQTITGKKRFSDGLDLAQNKAITAANGVDIAIYDGTKLAIGATTDPLTIQSYNNPKIIRNVTNDDGEQTATQFENIDSGNINDYVSSNTPTNMVTTNTEQTITSSKTFSGAYPIKSNSLYTANNKQIFFHNLSNNITTFGDINTATKISGTQVTINNSNAVTSDEITKIKKLTQAEYDALTTKDETAFYVIEG